MFRLVSGLMALYICWRLAWPLSVGAGTKAAITVILILASQHHVITRQFGSMASPEIPGWVLMVLGWAYGTILITACLFLLVDLVGILAYPVAESAGRALLDSSSWLRPGIAIAVMLLVCLGVWRAVRVPDVRSIEITLPQLPAAFDGYRLVQLTDLHASRLLQRPWMAAVAGKANALKPDLMLLTGDMVDGSVAVRIDDVAPLRDLHAPDGVFAIPGNHEYYSDYHPWIAHFESLGLKVLLNEHVRIAQGDAAITLAGITDPAATRFGMTPPDIDTALAGVPTDSTVILMSHRPTGAEKHASAGASLQLSGHTHGGQIAGLHWVTQWANQGFVSGLYTVGAMQLSVSNGAGLWNGLPIRLGRPAEITEITLRSSDTTLVSSTNITKNVQAWRGP